MFFCRVTDDLEVVLAGQRCLACCYLGQKCLAFLDFTFRTRCILVSSEGSFLVIAVLRISCLHHTAVEWHGGPEILRAVFGVFIDLLPLYTLKATNSLQIHSQEFGASVPAIVNIHVIVQLLGPNSERLSLLLGLLKVCLRR